MPYQTFLSVLFPSFFLNPECATACSLIELIRGCIIRHRRIAGAPVQWRGALLS